MLTIMKPPADLKPPALLGISVPVGTVFTGELYHQFGVAVGTFYRLQSHIICFETGALYGCGVHASGGAVKIHGYRAWPNATLTLEVP